MMLSTQTQQVGVETKTAYATPSSDILVASPDTQRTLHASLPRDNRRPRSPTSATQDGIGAETLSKPKQKRNKPTLSCLECVERKTKCDRARPCLACVKRQTQCEYTLMANMLASSADSAKQRPQDKVRYINTPPAKKRKTASILASDGSIAQQPSSFLLSSTPYAQNNPSNVFGLGTQHPFSNYWTCSGGLAEVIGILPPKQQCDILVAKYFEVVDPVYPFLHRRTFYADYERFWSFSRDDQVRIDPSLLALLFIMSALGTQFSAFPAYEERSQTAEFYCSASHQALRIYSYLNRASTRSIAAMVLITYFLMNGNHASDAYAWAGIHLRQSYAMRLHRDPDVVVPEASVLEKQQRRKLWQAVFHNDTFLTILLRLPPTATHSDVPIESLADENEQDDDYEVEIGTHSRVENLMSISVIAPQLTLPPPPPQPHHVLALESRRDDVAYIRSMWHLAELVQETVSSPLSLGLPIANSAKHKESLVQAFQRFYKSCPPHLTQLRHTDHGKAVSEPRRTRQMLFLTSNYYHCLMLVHAAEDETREVECSVEAALEAAHHALQSFFYLWQCFPGEAAVWWVFQHRAFEESLLVAHLLFVSRDQAPQTYSQSTFLRAKEDIVQMMDIMEKYGEQQEMHTTRKAVLRQSFERIIV